MDARITKFHRVTILAMGLVFLASAIAVIVFAETMASCSEKYSSSLERKQAFLDSIKEDAKGIDARLRKNREFKITGEELGGMMPALPKLSIDTRGMCGTVTPEKNKKLIKSGPAE